MVCLSKSSWNFLWFSLLLVAFSCESTKNDKGKSIEIKTSQLLTSTFFDTLRYDEGNLYHHNETFIKPNDLLGVWFTPSREQPCSLIAVQYVFGSPPQTPSPVRISGFVNLVPKYQPNGAELANIGSQSTTFSFNLESSGGEQTVEMNTPMNVDNDLDLFIGWISSVPVNNTIIPVALDDSVACCDPPRSYLWSTQPDTMLALDYDLGVRAIFRCSATQPDTGNFTFELRWNKRNTDLDLYLVLPATKDTVYWNNREIDTGGKLDVDDNDGYGPEKIVHPIVLATPGTLALLGVHYYSPDNGKPSKASVLIYLNDVPMDTLGPCILKPSEWWNVAEFNLATGFIISDSCNVLIKPNISNRLK